MARQPILLFYVSKRRDAFALTLLKYLLERYGPWDLRLYRIDSEAFVFRRIRYYRPAAVILLDVKHPAQIAVLKQARRFGYRVFILPSEMQTSHAAGRHLYMTDRTRMEQVDLFLAPGPAMKQFLVDHQILPDDRIPIVGVPRYDYYVSPFADALQLDAAGFRTRYHLTEPLPVVLWASNNRLSFMRDRAADKGALIRWYQANKFDEVHDLDAWIDAFVGSHEDSLNHVEQLLSRFGDRMYFFYRPRQGEVVAPYMPFFRRFPNARLVPDEHLGNLLAYSDLVFHGFSLLGSEAWMFRKPTVSYCFRGLDRFYFDAFRGCEDVVTTWEALLEVTERFLAGRYSAEHYRPMQERFVEQWYHRVDGRSTARAAHLINAALQGASASVPNTTALASPWSDRAKFALKKALGIEDFAPLSPAAYRTMRERDWVITRKDVEKWSGVFDVILRNHQMAACPPQAWRRRAIDS